MVKVSKNLDRRLRLLRASLNSMRVLVNNGYKVPLEERIRIEEELKRCRELYRKEMLEVPMLQLLYQQ